MTEYEKALAFNRQCAQALQTVWEALNQGQQQKLRKEETVRALFARYGVGEEETV